MHYGIFAYRYWTPAIIKIFHQLEWSYISILYSNDVFGEGMYEKLKETLYDIDPPICFDFVSRLEPGADEQKVSMFF